MRNWASATPTSASTRPNRSSWRINEFREFLSFYPTNRRADYAQYKLGMAHFMQMRAAQRDQTETRDAIKEFDTFIERYPNSSLMPEAKARACATRAIGSARRTIWSACSITGTGGTRARSIASRPC